MNPNLDAVDPADIPEVAAYLETRDRLDAFRDEHAGVLRTFAALAERHNAALEAADKAVRTRGVSSGPFVAYSLQTRYDLDLLAARLGAAKWKALGGRFEQRAILEKTRLDALLERNAISEALAIEARTETLAYRKPKAVLP
jgi:hypothetical protein